MCHGKPFYGLCKLRDHFFSNWLPLWCAGGPGGEDHQIGVESDSNLGENEFQKDKPMFSDPISKLVPLTVFLLGVISFGANASVVTFSDDTFDIPNGAWTLFESANTNNGSGTISQQLAGGNPGSHLEGQLQMEAGIHTARATL